MSASPNDSILFELAIQGPYLGRPSCAAIGVRHNPAPSTMPRADKYVALTSHAELPGDLMGIDWVHMRHLQIAHAESHMRSGKIEPAATVCYDTPDIQTSANVFGIHLITFLEDPLAFHNKNV